jgi:hypothetical protein
VALIVVKAFENSIKNDIVAGHSVDYCWRLLIGLGALPGAVALYFRLTIPETPRYTMDIERDIQGAAGDVDAFISNGGYSHVSQLFFFFFFFFNPFILLTYPRLCRIMRNLRVVPKCRKHRDVISSTTIRNGAILRSCSAALGLGLRLMSHFT